MKSLKDSVALVTGGSRGIGRAIVQELTAHGATVAINYHQNAKAAQDLVAELSTQGFKVIALQGDVGQEEQVRSMINQATSQLGQLDILVNNAGINNDSTLAKMTGTQWRSVIETNLNSAFYCTSAAIPHMIQAGGGKIINIGSILGQQTNIGQVNYATSKAGLVGFTHAAAMELIRYNITVNAVCPGFIATDMLEGLPPYKTQRIVDRIPMGRLGSPQEIASFVRYLLVEQGWSTGQCFSINGGMFVSI